MKIIVKDAQEAIEVAEILQKAAGTIWFDMGLHEIEQKSLSDCLYAMRDNIEVVSKNLPADIVKS